MMNDRSGMAVLACLGGAPERDWGVLPACFEKQQKALWQELDGGAAGGAPKVSSGCYFS